MERQENPVPDVNIGRMLISEQFVPWYKSIFTSLKERFSASEQAPLILTSQPVESASFGALAEAEEPWFKSIVRNLKDAFSREKLPPLQVTSKPIDDAAFGALAEAEEPFYKSLIANVRDIVRPKKLPPLEVTSKPVEVGSIWGAYAGGESKSAVVSVLVHVGVVALLIFAFQTKPMQKLAKNIGTIIYTPPYQPKIPKAAQQAQGGGGMKQPTPINHGAAPRFQKAFVPPVLTNPQPKLQAPTGISAVVPQIQADNYGDPLSKLMGATGGSGSGTGIGNGNGDGYGPGSGGNQGGGVYRPGGDVSAPSILVKVDPEYSEEARKAKYSGVVLLSIVVDEHGLPRDIKVIRPLGLGLDQKAVEAVQRWRFVPGRKGGRPVATQATVEVSFRLL
jgi:TonB family protein